MKKALSFLLSIALGIAFAISLPLSYPALSQGGGGSNSAQNRSPAAAERLNNISIGVLERERPAVAQQNRGRRLRPEEVANSDIDALLLSEDTLRAARSDRSLNRNIRGFIASGKILVVENATNEELKENLEVENMPTVETDEPILYSAVVETSTGTTVAGLVLGSSSTPELEVEEDLPTILRETIASLEDIGMEENRRKGWELRQRAYINYPACPYGRFEENAFGEQFLGDGSSANDYFNVRLKQVSSGGTLYCSTRYQTDTLYSEASVFHGYNSITDYGPTTTDAGVSTSVAIGYGTFEKTWSFTTPDVSISDLGNTPELAAWRFNYRVGSDAAKYRYLSEPGIFVQTPQGTSLTVYREILMRFVGGSLDFLSPGSLAKTYRINFTNYN